MRDDRKAEAALQPLARSTEVGEGGEQEKGPSTRDLDELHGLFHEPGQKRLLTRVGHARRQIKHRLPLVIERGGDPKLVSLADTQSLAREGEIVQNGKRRGSQNGSFHPLEKHLRERTGDIHRSGAEEDPMTTRFRPGHRVGFLGREDPPERRHDLRGAPLDEHGLLGGRGAGRRRSDKRVQRR